MKRLIFLFLSISLLLLPAAALSGQSGLLLRSTEEGGTVCSDTPLGSYAADTLRLAAGADLALLPSDLLGINLPPGTVDEAVLSASLLRDEAVYTVTLTPADLAALLEVAASRLTTNIEESLDREASNWGGFLQVSGILVIYDVPAPVGERVYSLKLADGTELDPADDATTLTAALPASLLEGGYGFPALTAEEEVGTLYELMLRRIADEGIEAEPDSRRILLYGCRENDLIDYFPPGLIVMVVLIFAFFGGSKWRRKFDFTR